MKQKEHEEYLAALTSYAASLVAGIMPPGVKFAVLVSSDRAWSANGSVEWPHVTMTVARSRKVVELVFPPPPKPSSEQN